MYVYIVHIVLRSECDLWICNRAASTLPKTARKACLHLPLTDVLTVTCWPPRKTSVLQFLQFLTVNRIFCYIEFHISLTLWNFICFTISHLHNRECDHCTYFQFSNKVDCNYMLLSLNNPSLRHETHKVCAPDSQHLSWSAFPHKTFRDRERGGL